LQVQVLPDAPEKPATNQLMTHGIQRGLLFALFPLFCAGIVAAAPADDALAWPEITAQARPWTYWWWMGSAVDRTNLTRELQRYRDAGLGGVHIIPIYGAKGRESNYVSYLSPKWMELLNYTVSEAQRLGLGVDMTTGTGWCFGGPDVSDRDANASIVVKTFDVAAGEKLKEKFAPAAIQALVAFSADGKSVALTDKISAAGEVDWTAPGDSWRVYAVSQKPSGQKVKRAAPGGEGWMLNPFYPPAMSNYLGRFTDAFAHYPGSRPRAQYQDSYEYKSDWAPDFFAQFEKRRGYKLQAELPALFGTNQDDHATRVKSDYRETVSDLMVEETMPRWIAWSHQRGFLTRYQAHGAPGNLLDLYALADIPETEMFRANRNPLVAKFASSAAHVAGRPLVSAETGTWLAEHFTETLGEMKSLVDEMFLSGINHVFYHGTCYSPDEAGWPGWVFYASTEMNPRNPIWRDAPALNDYIARCQSILQSGKPDNDILLYWPIYDYWSTPTNHLLPLKIESQSSWFEKQPIGKTAQELWENDYAFDYVSDAQLKTANVTNGQIHMPGGNYRVLVVPECKFIPLNTFKQLLALAENGATVIFNRKLPVDVSGAGNLEKQREEFKKLIEQIQTNLQAPAYQNPLETKFGNGHIFVGWFMSTRPLALHVIHEPMALAGLPFIHRAFEGGWNYFIANRSATNYDGWAALNCSAKSVAILDPMTGKAGVAAIRQNAIDLTEVRLQLAAGQSIILRAFAAEEIDGRDAALRRPVGAARQPYLYWQTSGEPVEISGYWNVKFIAGGPTLPADFQTTKPASWTTFPDTNTQAFAGTAKCEITFDAPDTLKRELQHFYLDLGDVRQSARVRLNGRDYGTLITPPFRVVVDNLKPAGNVLEVEVTSVAANRIRDLDRRGVPWKNFHDINIVNVDYRPFSAADWPLTDCGLLGPVTLTAVMPEQPASAGK
jgi:hypothetical protein